MALSQFTMGLFLLLLWRDNRAERALVAWATTNFFCCFLTYLFVLQGQVHPFVSVVLPSWGFIGFVVGYWVGLRILFQARQRWGVIAGALAVQSSIVIYFALFEPMLWPRFVVNAFVAAFLCYHLCTDVLRALRKTPFLAFRLFLGVFAVHGLIFFIAGVGALFTRPEGDYSSLNSGVSGIAILEGLLMFFLASICVAALIPEKLNKKLKQSAITDALSGLFNRTHFMEKLEAALEKPKANAGGVSVLFIDLDGFKEINDQHGHHIGDQLLVQIARKLADVTSDIGLVARMGGDEFAIFIEGSTSEADSEVLAGHVIEILCQPLSLDHFSVAVSCSIGIAPRTEEGESALELVRRADIAMYAAKSAGRACYAIFSAAMDEEIQEANWLRAELDKAIEAGDITVAYQPKFDVTGLGAPSITSVEALARWNHPERGFISPAKFITVAEESGQIIELSRLVLDKACRTAAPWAGVTLSVNLSPRQLSDLGLKDDILNISAAAGLPPDRLELEITEGVLLIADERVKEVFKDLQAEGVSLALDDFGTGYSSFSYLRDCNFDTVKIDRLFVQAMEKDEQALEVTQAVVSLAKALDLAVVAEGVETESQFDQLRTMGCDMIQGYYLSRPLAPEQLEALLDEEAKTDELGAAAEA